jgi:hypothetical protein
MLQVFQLLRRDREEVGCCQPKCPPDAFWFNWQERCQFDDEDAELVARYDWHLSHPGRKWRYAVATVGRGKKIAMHRLILGVLPGLAVDHINGDTLDNRRANLRVISNASNIQNQHAPRGKSRFQGVAYQPTERKPWRAQIMRDYKRYNLGNYATEIEAAAAYDRGAVRFFGPSAKQNLRTPEPQP